MSDGVTVGVNILEILTAGMYRDSKVIFREYIQNSCDQIDMAIKNGVLAPNEGQVDLWIEDNKRNVSIKDNATGISATIFRETLYSIGESRKTLGEDKGFRGIGHWCGLGYCKTLVFTSKAKGESVESVMTCNAEKMRQMLDEHNLHKKHYTLDEVLIETVKFSENEAKDIDKHYFYVELFEIDEVHKDLYDLQQIKDYLSFVAPVGYATAFWFRNNIHKHAEQVGQPIQEYNVFVCGEKILKKYTPSFSTHSKGEDSITDVEYKEFKDDKGNFIAWLWFGISSFKAQISKKDQMRGIRLRTQNIQIGGDDALQKLFNEDRGQYYFIGEVFAIAKGLIPNSQRDYFNGNEARSQFERLLSDFFNDDLSYIYKKGSDINSKYEKIEKAECLEKEMCVAEDSGKNVTKEQREKLERARIAKNNAILELTKIKQKNDVKSNSNGSNTIEIVVDAIIKKNEEKRAIPPLQPTSPTSKTGQTITKPALPKGTVDKHVSVSKVFNIIRQLTDTSTAETIIARIEKELL